MTQRNRDYIIEDAFYKEISTQFTVSKLLISVTICILLLFTINSLHSQQIIEDFNSGYIELLSYPGEDLHPDSWNLDSTNTYQDSEYSLKLYGNTWKILEIDPFTLDTGSVWQVAAFVQSVGRYQGFGLMDDENVLFYSFAGTTMLNPEEWICVYQGVYQNQNWNIYQLPVGSDWMAWYQYEPVIDRIVFVNDNDNLPNPGVVFFDQILDITEIIPVSPLVQITSGDYRIITENEKRALRGRDSADSYSRYAEIHFTSYVYDPEYDQHEYFWEFGDGSTSNEQHPVHIYNVVDNHPYTVFLAVVNPAGKWGFASTQIVPPEGDSSLPLKMNFVGDIMLARRYVSSGIIPVHGVESIFEPTLHLLGNAADLTVINLEAPLTTATTMHPTKTICFKGLPEYVSGLVYAGVDVASLANNHILDFMLPGLQETQQVLENAGILHGGAGADSYEAYQPIFTNVKGQNISFLASSDRNGHYNNFQPYLEAGYNNKPGFAFMTPYYTQQQILSVRDVSDLVVMLLHSGSEYSLGPISDYDYFWRNDPYPGEEYFDRLDTPKMWDREIRHFMIDNGADLVINHHPHIIQGIEVYNGKVIAHSLGNFAFDMDRAETMPSMILNAEADETGFTAFSVTPVYIDKYIPQPALGELGLHILDYLARRSKDLDTYLHVDRNAVRAHVIMDTLSMVYQDYFSYGDLSFINQGGFYSSQPLRLERKGFLSELSEMQPQANFQYRLGRERVWFGNFEDEGCSQWITSSSDVWYDTSESLEGNRSLVHRRTAGTGSLTSNIANRIFRYENDGHTLYGHIKTQNASNSNILIRYYANRTWGSILASESVTTSHSGTNDWEFFYKDLSVPSNGSFFDIVLSSSGPGVGIGYTWFDNVGLIEWTEWESYEPFTQIENPNDFYFVQFRTNDPISNAGLFYKERSYAPSFYDYLSIDEHNISPVGNAVLHKNYPNPFNLETFISFTSNEAGKAEVEIFNIKGQKVRKLTRDDIQPGELTTLSWDGRNEIRQEVASGVYFYRLLINDKFISARKCLLLK